jgi:predicted exporter
MASIGSVSAVLLLLVMLVVFRGIRPTLLGFLPVAVGCQVATAALLWMGGGKVHLIAMVFGATIVGVAEDYGMLFIAGLYEEGAWNGTKRMAEVGRSIFLGMLTSVAGYVALFFVPIPGLRQIGIFSIAGLAASWLTVALWYPWLSKGLKPVGPGPRRAAAAIARNWPRLREGRYGTPAALALLLAASIWGCLRLRADDDVRLLYAQDETLKAEQQRVSSAVRLPGAGRFFLIKGPDREAILQAEERLKDSLAAAAPEAAGMLGVTSFVPSAARQVADAVLLHKALLGTASGKPGGRLDVGFQTTIPNVAERLAADLDTPELPWRLADTLAAGAHPLVLEAWLSDPVSLPFRHLWRDSAAMLPLPTSVSLGAERLAALARAAAPTAVFVDPLQDVTDTLGSLRRHVAWVLGIGGMLVALALIPLLKKRAWAALAPAALGVAAGLGCLGFSGLPLNLAGLLALALILGMGIDYGIFVQESRRQRASALVAINLGAATNMIAFGMLAFSSTPALKAFGLVLGAGLGAAWLTAPCFAPPSEGSAHAA